MMIHAKLWSAVWANVGCGRANNPKPCPSTRVAGHGLLEGRLIKLTSHMTKGAPQTYNVLPELLVLTSVPL